MNIMTKTFFGLLAAASFSTSALAEGWLCIADHAAGFKYNETSKDWEPTTFKTNKKYLIKESGSGEFKWHVTEFGSIMPVSFCAENRVGKGYIFNCEGIEEFILNTKNGRFMSIYAIGYWTLDPNDPLLSGEADNTPSMQIGTCSKL